jgi:hypothetical protein
MKAVVSSKLGTEWWTAATKLHENTTLHAIHYNLRNKWFMTLRLVVTPTSVSNNQQRITFSIPKETKISKSADVELVPSGETRHHRYARRDFLGDFCHEMNICVEKSNIFDVRYVSPKKRRYKYKVT